MATQLQQPPPYICKYCNRDYKIVDNFKKHQICCEFFHKTRRERCQQTEEFETLPSQRDLFRIIQDLALRCNRLEKEVSGLKSTISSRKRKEVLEYLNQMPAPGFTFREWVKAQTIEFHHLECVFEYNLTEGIKMCIQESLDKDSANTILLKSALLNPICAFEQRPGQFYVYDASGNASGCWKRMEPDMFDHWMTTLSHRFLQYFIEWQTSNFAHLSSEKDKEDNINQMIKVNGGRNPTVEKERRSSEIRKWLFSKIQISSKSLVEIV